MQFIFFFLEIGNEIVFVVENGVFVVNVGKELFVGKMFEDIIKVVICVLE